MNKIILIMLVISACTITPQPSLKKLNPDSLSVLTVGTMEDSQKNRAGKFSLAQISNKKNIYAVGVGENLIGEILILDSKKYYITSIHNNQVKVNESSPTQATFFLFSEIPTWQAIPMPKHIHNLKDLEDFIDQQTAQYQKLHYDILPFLIKGKLSTAKVHIARIDTSSYFKLKNVDFVAIGFFTKKYTYDYTYKSSKIHSHLITKNKKIGGHVDELNFKNNELTLYLPKIEK